MNKKLHKSSLFFSDKFDFLLVFTVGILFFIPFPGNVHLFDWDEINFAESAREMIVTKDYLNVKINYELFWEKPPLFIWLQVISMKIFGINEFAARFPNAITGILTLLLIFREGKKIYNRKFAIIWTLTYLGSILPHLYFKSGIIDPLFNLFIFTGILYFIKFLNDDSKRYSNLSISAVSVGLAVMTKGPVGLLIFLLTGFVYLLFHRFRMRINFKQILVYIAVFSFTGGFWFFMLAINGHTDIIHDFIEYQIRLFQTKDAGHGGFFAYHFVVLLFGVFPASFFALKSFKKNKNDTSSQKMFKSWMIILFWTVLILFTIVKTKIVHYSSMCYFPLTYLAAYAIFRTDSKSIKKSKIISGLIIFTAFVYSIAVSSLQFFDKYKIKIIDSGMIKDDFAIANMQANPHWSGYEFLTGVLYFILLITVFVIFRKNYLKKVTGIFILTAFFINVTLTVIVPKIEKYSQNAAIEFYEKHSAEDSYINTYGFKSYAHLFYAKKKMPENDIHKNEKLLLSGKADKTSYYVTKITKEKEFAEKYINYKKIYSKNGFVFFVCEAKK